MTRDIDAQAAAEFLKPLLCPIGLVELFFDSGTVRFWTGWGEIIWNEATWYGTGNLGGIGEIEETVETRATSVELSLSGIPAEVLAIANSEDYQGREAIIYYGVLNENNQFVGEPFQLRHGLMDVMTLIEGEQATLALTIESRDIDLGRVKVRRYTAEDQRSEYPGDAGCDSIAMLQEKNIIWNIG